MLTQSPLTGSVHVGATLWLTGLPAAGKSTVAYATAAALVASGRAAYVLDGDELRQGLCVDLGFDPVSRTENVRRISHVAEIMAHAGLVAIVALISPYADDRAAARRLHERRGLMFKEVFVETPLEVCMRRDPKGIYRRALDGELQSVTGISDRYDVPIAPDLRICTIEQSVGEAVNSILAVLDGSA
jgi:bifunctional enzyme CysN/CysC